MWFGLFWVFKVGCKGRRRSVKTLGHGALGLPKAGRGAGAPGAYDDGRGGRWWLRGEVWALGLPKAGRGAGGPGHGGYLA